MSAVAGLIAVCCFTLFGSELRAQDPARIPVIVDTDIGTDIDDAFALALLLQCPELELRGITTVSGDAPLRARLAAKLLSLAGDPWGGVPVYAGTTGPVQPLAQGEWARDFTAPNLHLSGGVEFLRDEINRHPGRITLLALGELTNIAALLTDNPRIAGRIRRIVLMGGALARGYDDGSPAVPEWNIRSNVAAARTVFASGVPLTMVPLDVTIMLKLDAGARARIFSHGTPVNAALAALTATWQGTNPWKLVHPVLFDSLPVALLARPALAETMARHIEIAPDGLTRAWPGAPNADVVVRAPPEEFFAFNHVRLSAPSAPVR